jgi:hypothetical protein
MVRYRFFNNIVVDGHYFTEGILGLDWLPSDKAKKQAAAYEYNVGKALSEIAAYNWTGLAVIWAIADARREILVVPDRSWEEKHKEHAQAYDQYGQVIVEFSPASADSLQCHNGQRAARRPDEILLHELIHGLRMARGQWQPGSYGSGSLLLYGNREEFLAILLTNIYMSEKRRSPLRGVWATTKDECGVLPADSSTSKGFLDDDLRLQQISDFSKWENKLFKDVENAKAAFNPVAEYLAHKSKYEDRLRETNPFMN